jgi:hypothetical protein
VCLFVSGPGSQRVLASLTSGVDLASMPFMSGAFFKVSHHTGCCSSDIAASICLTFDLVPMSYR